MYFVDVMVVIWTIPREWNIATRTAAIAAASTEAITKTVVLWGKDRHD
jgi:hypothetical protein